MEQDLGVGGYSYHLVFVYTLTNSSGQVFDRVVWSVDAPIRTADDILAIEDKFYAVSEDLSGFIAFNVQLINFTLIEHPPTEWAACPHCHKVVESHVCDEV